MQRNLLISLRACALVTLILQCSPMVALAAADEPLTTAGLMAQASDPAVTTATAEPVVDSASVAEPASSGFDTEQLEQLVAPIALYPDALLMQILMASTYPLEIVEADRWISKQPDLTGDALNEALKGQDWDPSVKSLTTLPSVLSQMSQNLDWTQDLGDAFLAQQNDLMDTVQRMRGLAYEAGNLESTEQQTVQQQEDKIIIIESTSPEVIYVPTYSPTVVYGAAWGYPSYYYPAYYYPPMAGYGLVAFGVGVAVGGAIWGNAGWGWGRNEVNIDIDRNTEFNRNTDNNFNGDREGGRGEGGRGEGSRGEGGRGEGGRGEGGRGEGGTGKWQHDSSHRKGVNYGSSDVAQKFGGNSGSNRVTQDQARGRSSSPTASNRGGTGTQAGNRSAATPRTNSSPSASNRSQGGANSSRSSGSSARSSSNSAFSGSRSPSTDRMSSSRGASSRGSRSYGGSRGGASRGGGRRR